MRKEELKQSQDPQNSTATGPRPQVLKFLEPPLISPFRIQEGICQKALYHD